MNGKRNNRNWILITISVFLILFGIAIIGGKYVYQYLVIQENKDKITEYFDNPIVETKEVLIIEDDNKEIKVSEPINQEKYIAILEIPKIDLKRGVYAKNSKLNNVNKNIYLLNESDMPDKVNGNFILAGHSGTAYISFFKNLPKLSINDIAFVYYSGSRYSYKLVNKYEIDKTGKANIIRNSEKNTMTLITCKNGTEKQLLFIFELLEGGE